MKKNIIAAYHHSFAGGSKNASRFFHFLSNNGCNVDGYFYETPQYFTYTKSNVRVRTLNGVNVHSEVIDPVVLQHYTVVNTIVADAEQKENCVLFGANLFPYCNILHDVKSQLLQNKTKEPKLFLHPVGSDIWQIGPQIKPRVKWLLDDPIVDCVFTYSSMFADEIKEYYGIKREIHILPPVLETERFFPLGKGEIMERRKSLNIGEEDFVIHHHSSMRKIKCPEIILEIAIKSSELIPKKTVLLMEGPVPFDVLKAGGLNLIEPSGHNGVLKYETDVNNLTIYWTGITSHVEYLLQTSDVEINASLHDSFNLSLMEAMACGLPVVTSEVVGITEHIKVSNSGYCFPTKKLSFDDLNKVLSERHSPMAMMDVDSAVDAVVEIAKHEGRSESMGKNGAAYVVDHFSFDKAQKVFYKHLQ